VRGLTILHTNSPHRGIYAGSVRSVTVRINKSGARSPAITHAVRLRSPLEYGPPSPLEGREADRCSSHRADVGGAIQRRDSLWP
jgi:hypothetical protein